MSYRMSFQNFTGHNAKEHPRTVDDTVVPGKRRRRLLGRRAYGQGRKCEEDKHSTKPRSAVRAHVNPSLR